MELVNVIDQSLEEQACNLGANSGSSHCEGNEGIKYLRDWDAINLISNYSVKDLHGVARTAQRKCPGELYCLLSINIVRVLLNALFKAP